MNSAMILINIMATYSIASVIYLVITLGKKNRPFYKSLTRKQRHVLLKTKKKRRNIFILSCVIAVAFLFYLNPFGKSTTLNYFSGGGCNYNNAMKFQQCGGNLQSPSMGQYGGGVGNNYSMGYGGGMHLKPV